MHGRLKVRTTEEERERKKKEQSLKVKAYNAAMSKIQTKRQKKEFDDEMLQLTLPILQRNPDVYTLWNIRRLCIEKKRIEAEDTLNHDDDNDDDKAKNLEKLQTIYEIELNVTEQCLMVNPKSYSAWHHRCWALENSPNANWQREMRLCSKYLKLDERNFHTWDYRRYVALKAGISKEDELDFCTEKIKANFSNYSSWHYRSLLLPVLFPHEGVAVPKRPISEEKLKEELEMVLSAAFTDPNDSSAWFYQRWLLGYSRPDLDICSFRCDNRKAVIALTKPINASNMEISLHKGDNCILKLNQWESVRKSVEDNIWYAKIEGQISIEKATDEGYHLKVNIPNLNSKEIKLFDYEESLYWMQAPNPPIVYSQDVLNELQTQLDSCKSLLEFEPDSKWTLLTTSLLMRAIDRTEYHDKSLDYLQKLVKVDSLRRGYYEDLASKWIIEQVLTNWLNSKQAPGIIDLSDIDNLTSIGCYEQYFCIAKKLILPPKLERKYTSKNRSPIVFSSIDSIIKD